MPVRKITKKYYFSVEGETEQWYLEWLRDLINASPSAKCKVVIDCKVQKDPVKRAEGVMERNKENGYVLHEYKGFKYYKENPALAVWEIVKEMLEDSGLKS